MFQHDPAVDRFFALRIWAYPVYREAYHRSLAKTLVFFVLPIYCYYRYISNYRVSSSTATTATSATTG